MPVTVVLEWNLTFISNCLEFINEFISSESDTFDDLITIHLFKMPEIKTKVVLRRKILIKTYIYIYIYTTEK